jgi:hypothetical protein
MTPCAGEGDHTGFFFDSKTFGVAAHNPATRIAQFNMVSFKVASTTYSITIVATNAVTATIIATTIIETSAVVILSATPTMTGQIPPTSRLVFTAGDPR